MQLRDYQTYAANAAIRKLAIDGEPGTLLVLPTGTGKTIVFSNVARRWIEGRGERILVLAHRKELIEQARDKLLRSTDLRDWQVGVERAESRSSAGQPVVVGSVQTLKNGKRLGRFPYDAFGLVIVDEAHHVAAAGYSKVLAHFGVAKRLGVTATPYRLDGANLGAWFSSYAFQYELGKAIEDGWLVPIIARRVILEDLDLRGVRRTAGDFNKGELARVMERRILIEEVSQPTLDHAGDRPTLVFATSVEHARLLAESFNRHRPGCAASIDGRLSMNERESILTDFATGEFQFLVNCELLTEGVDIPQVACVAMARPTQSRGLYMQALGRGTRLLGLTMEESIGNGKEDLLVLDFVGLTAKHRAVDVLDVLVPGLSALAREKTEEQLLHGGRPMEIAREEENRLQQQAEVVRLRSAVEVKYRLTDPEHLFRVPLDRDDLDNSASDWQVEQLSRMGVRKADKLSARQAEHLLSNLRERRALGLCTYRQALQLRRYGLDPDMKFEDASRVITRIAEASWPRPNSREFQALELSP